LDPENGKAKRGAAYVQMERKRSRRSFSSIQAVHFGLRKILGVWSIPKGEYAEGEGRTGGSAPEFEEETGMDAGGEPIPLNDIRQPGGKVVSAWALAGDCDASKVRSNMFSMEWPPKSGRTKEFPEIDRGEWFPIEAARAKLLKGQLGFWLS